MRVLLVAIAGAAGALCRYGIGVAAGVQSFPWPTLAVNSAGSFLLGLLLAGGSGRLSDTVVVMLSVGFLGAFTTFSTFSYETQTLLRTGRGAAALLYVALSVLLGIAGAAVGYACGRALAN